MILTKRLGTFLLVLGAAVTASTGWQSYTLGLWADETGGDGSVATTSIVLFGLGAVILIGGFISLMNSIFGRADSQD